MYPTAHGCPVTATASVVAVFYFCQVGALFQGPQWSALNFLDLDVDYFKPACTSRAQGFSREGDSRRLPLTETLYSKLLFEPGDFILVYVAAG